MIIEISLALGIGFVIGLEIGITIGINRFGKAREIFKKEIEKLEKPKKEQS